MTWTNKVKNTNILQDVNITKKLAHKEYVLETGVL